MISTPASGDSLQALPIKFQLRANNFKRKLKETIQKLKTFFVKTFNNNLIGQNVKSKQNCQKRNDVLSDGSDAP